MNKAHRQHPLAMLRYTGRFLFVLLIPLWQRLRSIRTAHSLYDWLAGSWMDLAALCLILGLAALAWWRHTYRLTTTDFTVQRGLWFQRRTTIPLDRITTMTIQQPLLLRLFGAVRVIVDTEAGNHRMADVQLIIGRQQAIFFRPDAPVEHPPLTPQHRRVLLLCLLASDSLGGVLVLATTLYQIGAWLGEGVRQTLLDNLQAAAAAVTVIPYTAALLGLVLLGGWVIGAAGHLLGHLPFQVYKQEETLVISTGWFTRRTHCCAIGAIHYTDIRQTLPSRILRAASVYLSCTGYGKDKNTLAVLLPPAGEGRIYTELTRLLPSHVPTQLTVRPPVGALWRYVRLPLCLMGILLWLLPELTPLYPALIPCLWFLILRCIAFYTAGIGWQDGRLTLRYARRLTLHHVTVPFSHIAAIRIRSTPFQRRSGHGDVWIYTQHEFRRPHRLRHLPLAALEQLHPLFRKEG